MVELSIVIPVYRCADCLTHLYERLEASLRSVTSSYELIFVDDRSPDDGWRVLEGLAARDPRVRVFRLSRNFGQHAALTAGLALARGRWAVVMDCDLQDPPEQIGALYAKAQEGFDVVFARRIYPSAARFRKAASRTYSRLLKVMAGIEIDPDFGNFSVISRKVVDAFLTVRDRDRHYLMIVHWLGFEHTSIEFPRADRFAGESAYSVGALVRFAFDGLFFQTTRLLRWIVYLGFAISLAGAGMAIFVVYFAVAHNPYPGWTSLVVLLLLVGGFIIISTGVTGLYIGKIFAQVKDRPLYIIDTGAGSDVSGEESVAAGSARSTSRLESSQLVEP